MVVQAMRRRVRFSRIGTALERSVGMRPSHFVSAFLLLGAIATSVPTEAAMLNCGVYQRAVVRHAWVSGHRVDRISCISNTRTQVVRRRVVHHRSWKKTALVIGGSSAAGAGVGALVGGKKGALIGAAAGAGAGTVYEVHKRRHHRRYR
jgi:hypothetical protein